MKSYHMFAFGSFVGYAFSFMIIIIFMRYDGKIDPTIHEKIPGQEELFSKVFPCFRFKIFKQKIFLGE